MTMTRRQTRAGVLAWLLMAAVLLLVASITQAADIPRAALHHRADLVRIAHAEWGLDAPIAAFAAQVHQESGWNPEAVSRVGARGMAQFMPATARWWCEVNKLSVEACQPSNPVWAMRALVGYDRWLFERSRGATEFDRFWAALRAYNGGLGHWLAEAKIAGSHDRLTVDAACGQARRSAVHCPENLGYPRRILLTLQPRYLAWGRGLS